mmetsp:Transcript_132806/g.265035  ORF Transcript_132806/g.265035 Transcript_132806/m.265035 type:complete len:235 (-) Transcript_132806:200-904(-)
MSCKKELSCKKEHIFYKSKLCTFFANGTCPRAHKCRFAHGADELRATPDLSQTKLCQDFITNGSCSKGAFCTFAHSFEELRILNAPSGDVPQVPQVSYDVSCMSATDGKCMEASRGGSAKVVPTHSRFTVASLLRSNGDGGGAFNTITHGPVEQSRGSPDRKTNLGGQVSQSELFKSFPGFVLEPNASSNALMVHPLTGLKCRVQNSFLSFEDSGVKLGIRRSFSEGSLQIPNL